MMGFAAFALVALTGPVRSVAQAPVDAAVILGGSDSDRLFDVAVDPAGNLYAVGETFSADFPVLGGIQPTLNGTQDAFVAKIDPSGQLLYSTYLGGSGFDSARGIAVDSAGNAYVVGYTTSADFPRQNPLDANRGGLSDGFISKLGPQGNVLLFSTYFGGNSEDSAEAIAIDAQGNLYVSGRTSGGLTTINAAQPNYGGNEDAYVLRLNAPMDAYAYVSYLGGAQLDYSTAIGVDPSGRACVVGFSGSIDFPRVNASQPPPGTPATQDGFYTLFDPAGSTLLVSSLIGGAGFDQARGVACNATHLAVVGDTLSTDFPAGSSIGSAVQAALAGDKDAFVAVFGNPGGSRNYATLHGGRRNDTFANASFDQKGALRVFGDTASSDLPDGSGLSLDLTGTGVFRSTDGGATWQASALQGMSVNDFAIAATTPRTLLAATDRGLFVSTDDGAHWNVPAGDFPGRVVHAVSADPANACTWIIGVDAATAGGIGASASAKAVAGPAPDGAARTTNCGADWQGWGEPARRYTGIKRLTGPNRLVVTVDRLATDGNGTLSDTCVTDGDGARVRCFGRGASDSVIAVDGSDPCSWIEAVPLGGSVFKITGNQFGCDHPFSSSGTGASFNSRVTALVVAPATATQQRRFVAGTQIGRVFMRLDDGTAVWTQVPGSFDVPVTALEALNDGKVLASIGSVLRRIEADGSSSVEVAHDTGAAGFGNLESCDQDCIGATAPSADAATGTYDPIDNDQFELSTTGGTCSEEAAAAASADVAQYFGATVPGFCGLEDSADVYGSGLDEENAVIYVRALYYGIFGNSFENPPTSARAGEPGNGTPAR